MQPLVQADPMPTFLVVGGGRSRVRFVIISMRPVGSAHCPSSRIGRMGRGSKCLLSSIKVLLECHLVYSASQTSPVLSPDTNYSTTIRFAPLSLPEDVFRIHCVPHIRRRRVEERLFCQGGQAWQHWRWAMPPALPVLMYWRSCSQIARRSSLTPLPSCPQVLRAPPSSLNKRRRMVGRVQLRLMRPWVEQMSGEDSAKVISHKASAIRNICPRKYESKEMHCDQWNCLLFSFHLRRVARRIWA